MKRENKILDKEALALQLNVWRFKDQSIVFTNGCFDILHAGHIHLLDRCDALGHKLIVGLNTDASVQRLKGPGRPVNSEQHRAIVVAALSMVDAVVFFEEDTPLELIKRIKPDVLAKGGDYSIDRIVGADLVIKNGGKVEIIDFLEGHSTTGLIKSLKQS